MSAPTAQFTEQFTEIAQKAQDSVTTAVRTWADAVQTVADGFTAEKPVLPDAGVVVDRYFDFAQQVLDSQRHFARTVLSAGTQAAQAVTEQTTAAAKQAAAPAATPTKTGTTRAKAAAKS